MTKEKFPGLNNMTIDEVRVMARVCKNDGCDTEKTLEYITCIDDCLTILRSAAMINRRRGNQRNRVTARDVIEARIMQAKL
jgi:hypothetical protein